MATVIFCGMRHAIVTIFNIRNVTNEGKDILWILSPLLLIGKLIDPHENCADKTVS